MPTPCQVVHNPFFSLTLSLEMWKVIGARDPSPSSEEDRQG